MYKRIATMVSAFVILVVAWISTASLAGAETLELLAQKDTHVRSIAPNDNFGSDSQLRSGWNGQYGFYRTLLQFDVSSLVGGHVVSAEVLCFQRTTRGGAGGFWNPIYKILQPWSEGTVSWNAQPTFDGDWFDAEEIGDLFDNGTWKAWDITSLVREWISGGAPNHGVLIKQEFEDTVGAYRYGIFDSREYGADTAPRLLVEVEFPVPAERVSWGQVKSLYGLVR